MSQSENVDDLSIDQVLDECHLTPEQYHYALQKSAKDTTIYLKRQPFEVNINNYNPAILKAWQANMDIQFVSNPYACIQYVVSYITKEEREMAILLKAVSDEHNESGIRDQMKKCGQAFVNARSLSAQEAAYRTIGLPLYKSDFQTIFIPSGPPDQRVTILKPKYLLNKLEDDDEDVCLSGILQKYSHRPKVLNHWCLAHFVAWYTPSNQQPWPTCDPEAQPDILQETSENLPAPPLDEQVASAPDKITIELPTSSCIMRKRKKQSVIRYHSFSAVKEPELYYYSQIQLFKPWKNESSDILCGYQSYEDSYTNNKETILHNKSFIEHHADLIDEAIKEFAENGPPENAWNELAPQEIQDNDDASAEEEHIDPEHMILQPIDEHADNPSVPTPQLKGPALAIESAPNIWSDDEYRSHLQTLNLQQYGLFQIVLDWCTEYVQKRSLNNKKSPLYIFTSGGAGTGKSHLIRALYQMVQNTLRLEGETPDIPKILLLAPTGTAAYNIEGLTVHSALLLSLGQTNRKQQKDKSYQPLSDEKRNELRCKLSQLRFIIIDEISMVGSDMLLQIHSRLHELFGTDYPFGGISILAFGDLYQLPPVGQRFVFEQPSDKYASLSSSLWESFKYFPLTTIVRQQGDTSFASLLNRLRDGSHIASDIEMLQTRAITDTCQPPKPDLLHVYSWNEKVDQHNLRMLSDLPQPTVELQAVDKVPGSLKKNYKPSKDARYTGGLPDTLLLAKSARVMLIRNVDVMDGLANGSQGTIIDFIYKNNKPIVVLVKFDSPAVGTNARQNSKFVLSKYENSATPIEQLEVKFSFAGSNVKVSRLQFPLKLAWACTIHKVQGLTLNEIVISFENTFRDGQAYVALSRVKTLNGLYLSKFDKAKVKTSNQVKDEMSRLLKSQQIQSPFQEYLQAQGFKIVMLNARSASLHFQDISNHPVLQAADIICLSETHYQKNCEHSYQIPNFQLVLLPYCGKEGPHGLAIYTRSDVSSFNCSFKNLIENLEVNLAVPSINIQLLYRSPSGKTSDFISNLNSIVNFQSTPDIVLGDFNMDITTRPYKDLQSIMAEKNYKQIIDVPTYFTGSTLDLVFVPDNRNYKVDVFSTYFSDHKILAIVQQ